MSIPKEASTAFGTGLVAGKVMKFGGKLFPREAFKHYGRGIGERVGALGKKLNESGFVADGTELFVQAREIVDNLLKKSLRNRAAAKRLGGIIDREVGEIASGSQGAGLDAENLRVIKQAIDDFRIGSVKTLQTGEKKAVPVVDTQVGQAAKKIRNLFNDARIKIADKAGLKDEVVKADKDFSTVSKEFPQFGNEIGGLISAIVKAGGVFDLIGLDPVRAAGKFAVGEFLESKAAPNILFQAIKRGAQVASPAASETISQIRRS